jgi:anti-sigma regulatory factor (Ser/Thr protein kinase)
MQDALSLPLDFVPSSAAVAREHVERFVRPWAPVDFCDELRLLVTELAANAVLHGKPDVHLEACVVALRRVRIEVSDGSPELPQLRDHSVHSISGRGLHLVDALASAWGASPRLNGKVVWFELAQATRDETPTEVGRVTRSSR